MSWDELPRGTLENFQKQMGTMMNMVTGQDYDQCPINPFYMGHSAIAHGHTLYEYYTEPEKAIAWSLDIARMYQAVPNLMSLYATYWCEDYGGTIKMPTGRMSAPAVLTHPATTPDLADKLQPLTAEELAKGPTMKLHMRGQRAVEKYIGKDYTPMQFIYEPFVVASYWVSPESLLMWVHQEPDLVHDIMKKVETHCINACEAVSKAFDGKPFQTICATLLANSSTMSKSQCKEFATDHMKKALEKIVKIGAGSTGIFYHQCGDHAEDWDLCADMPFPTGSIMHVAYDGLKPFDLTKAAKVYENKAIMLGNFDTILAQGGTPKQIYDTAYDMMMRYKHFNKGFIMGMACECPPFMSAANLSAFVSGSKAAANMKE